MGKPKTKKAKKKKTIVIAIGGNSLIKDKDHQTVQDQHHAAVDTVRKIVDLIQLGYNVVVTHGNGPQVGFILLRSDIAYKQIGLHRVPVDYCGADTQGAIGYTLQRAFLNEFKIRKMNKRAVTVVTQTLVDRNDPAFKNPTKPIGSFYEKEEALKYQREEGWSIVEDAGRGFRRVIASPKPLEIIEIDAIKSLIDRGFVVIAVGGGGIPVAWCEDGILRGCEAVIDKDLGTSLLAQKLKADMFLISTAVEKVYLNFGTPDQKPIDKMTVAEAKKYMAEGHFHKGSMLPKIEAIIQYLEAGGKLGIITNPENLRDGVEGKTGTWIVP